MDSSTYIFVSAGVKKGTDSYFYGGGGRLPVVMMYILWFTFFLGTDATVGDGFAPDSVKIFFYETNLSIL